ncbi:hypothetical protein HY406_00595 [Candidatus Giovannonibacteria bacterium]|nr:hypothetical protein [Candidatus Giovannonibacteria bacterium]
MPHLSSKRVKKDVFEQMTNEFINAVAELKSKEEIKGFLRELLTPTERVMLAKRLAIILMLKKGYSFKIVEKTLKISSSTSLRFWGSLKTRPFIFLLKDVKRREARKKFWEELERLSRFGLPPRGKGRWARTLKLLDRE